MKMSMGHCEYQTLAALGLATITRAGALGIDSSTLNIGHQQTGEMPKEMASLSVDT